MLIFKNNLYFLNGKLKQEQYIIILNSIMNILQSTYNYIAS